MVGPCSTMAAALTVLSHVETPIAPTQTAALLGNGCTLLETYAGAGFPSENFASHQKCSAVSCPLLKRPRRSDSQNCSTDPPCCVGASATNVGNTSHQKLVWTRHVGRPMVLVARPPSNMNWPHHNTTTIFSPSVFFNIKTTIMHCYFV